MTALSEAIGALMIWFLIASAVVILMLAIVATVVYVSECWAERGSRTEDELEALWALDPLEEQWKL